MPDTGYWTAEFKKDGRRTTLNVRAVLLPVWLMGFFFWLPILLILSLCFIQGRDISLGNGQLLCLITDFAVFGIGSLFSGKDLGVLSELNLYLHLSVLLFVREKIAVPDDRIIKAGQGKL